MPTQMETLRKKPNRQRNVYSKKRFQELTDDDEEEWPAAEDTVAFPFPLGSMAGRLQIF